MKTHPGYDASGATLFIKLCKWIGSISYIVCQLLTSFNIFPLNLPFGIIGGILWVYVGYRTNDVPLVLVDLAPIVIFSLGLIHYWS